MKQVLTTLIAGILTLTFSVVNAAELPHSIKAGTVHPSICINATPAIQQQALDQSKLDYLGAQIKSREDLNSYLSTTPINKSPFDHLSLGAKSRFLSSLVFNEKGLVGYSYADLVAELPASEIYKVLSLFGAQSTVPSIKGAKIASESDKLAVHPNTVCTGTSGYECSGPHTCRLESQSMCMSGC